VDGNVKLGRAAARSGEWAQHFSSASCIEIFGFSRALQRIYLSVFKDSVTAHIFNARCYKQDLVISVYKVGLKG